jgi:hypothetical protein
MRFGHAIEGLAQRFGVVRLSAEDELEDLALPVVGCDLGDESRVRQISSLFPPPPIRRPRL